MARRSLGEGGSRQLSDRRLPKPFAPLFVEHLARALRQRIAQFTQ
jgi:hypothetical protein